MSIMMSIAAMRAVQQTELPLTHSDHHWHSQTTEFFHKMANDANFAWKESKKAAIPGPSPDKWNMGPLLQSEIYFGKAVFQRMQGVTATTEDFYEVIELFCQTYMAIHYKSFMTALGEANEKWPTFVSIMHGGGCNLSMGRHQALQS